MPYTDETTWTELHRLSERAAIQATLEAAQGNRERALILFAEAAAHEEKALASLGHSRPRTYAVTAVSAASLWLKARRPEALVRFAGEALAHPDLLAFARSEIKAVLKEGLGPRAVRLS